MHGHLVYLRQTNPFVEKTLNQYDRQLDICRQLFLKKNQDYGTAWRILRPASLTDQIFIKASRIRQIQETGAKRVDEPVSDAFIGIVNYGILALIQLSLPADSPLEMPADDVASLYEKEIDQTRQLMIDKNHDYGEAWRDMRISSLTDLILMKLIRVRQIEDREGKMLVSEGLPGNYRDIINYALFALIKLEEEPALK
ncbi:MAG: DUF1599 domain-containing protein [Bacteroidetes bacterium]|nr:DUF1599 domain-containing protein [Bacteroidota bacterium]